MRSYHNDGVHVSGGQINGPVAGGRNARAEQRLESSSTRAVVELRALVRELRDAVADGRLPVDDPPAVDDDLDLVDETLGQDRPDRGRLRRAAQRAAAALTASGAVPLATQLLELTNQVT